MKLNDCKMSAIEVTYAGWNQKYQINGSPDETHYTEKMMSVNCKDKYELFEQTSKVQKRVNGESIGQGQSQKNYNCQKADVSHEEKCSTRQEHNDKNFKRSVCNFEMRIGKRMIYRVMRNGE